MTYQNKFFILLILLYSYILVSCSSSQLTRAEATDGSLQQSNESAQQVGSYADWVENWLAEDHDLPTGEWLVEKEEEAALIAYSGSALQSELIDVANMPFEKALRIKTDSAQNAPWDSGTKTRTSTAIAEDDTILLTFWIRALDTEGDQGAVYIILQDKASSSSTIAEIIAVDTEWQQVILRGVAPIASDVDKAILFFATGAQAQELEIGGIAAINYENSVQLDALPQMDLHKYAGQEADAAWRDEADVRIDTHRKTDLKIIVLDADGEPIEDADIEVEMQKHAFVFGTSVNTSKLIEESDEAEIYRKRLLDLDGQGHGFNATVVETNMKWWRWESDDATYKQDAIQAIDWLLDNHIPVRGHTLIWPGWSNLPADLEENQDDAAYLVKRTSNRVTTTLADPALNGRLYEWDVLNEPRTNNDLAVTLEQNGIFRTGEQIYPQWFNLAAQSDRNAKLFVNEYGILSEGALFVGQHESYKKTIELLIENGDYLDGIGLQAHMDYPLTGPERLYSVLDDLGKYDKDIVITEYDLSLAYRDEPDQSEAIGAAYTRDFLTTIFSHPDVTGFLMWGFWDEIHWKDDSPMYRADWSLKPAGEAFVDLVFNQWWTNEQGATDENGAYNIRGFLGEYKIIVTADGARKTVNATLTPDNGAITVVFDGEDTTYSTSLPFVAYNKR